METEAINEIVRAGADSVDIDKRSDAYVDVPYVIVGTHQKLAVPDRAIELADERAQAPLRRRGHAIHYELESFIDHVNRNKGDHSVVWANTMTDEVLAVFNYHPVGGEASAAGWCDHTTMYTCPPSPEWLAWKGQAGKPMGQTEFAEFIESRFDDLISEDGYPAPMEMLEVARNLQIYTKGTFSKKIDPATGEFSMVCKQEHTAESTKIPRKFKVALRVYEGGSLYGVEARVRFRMHDGKPSFSYELHRAVEVKRDAFNDVRAAVGDETALPVYAGVPEVR